MPYLFKTVIASGTLAAGDAKLSMVDAGAFADSVDINLAQYVDGRSMLYLRNTTGGYEAFALLNAVGTGETLDVEKLGDPTFDSAPAWSVTGGFSIGAGLVSASNATGYCQTASAVTVSGQLVKLVLTGNAYTSGGYQAFVSGGTCKSEEYTSGGDKTAYLTGVTNGTVGIIKSTTNVTASWAGLSAKQVTAPSTSGVTLKNLAGAQSFIYKHASFNPNAEMLWRVVTDKKIYRIL